MRGVEPSISDASLPDLIIRVLEEETGDKFFLDQTDPWTQDGNSRWEVAVEDTVERGFIEQAWMSGRSILFRSFTILDLDWYMQHEYLEVVYDRLLEALGSDLDKMNAREIRQKYSMILLNEIALLDALDQILRDINRENSTELLMSSDGGVVTMVFEISADEVDSDGSRIREHVRAMKRLFRRMSGWLDDDEGKAREIFGQIPAKM